MKGNTKPSLRLEGIKMPSDRQLKRVCFTLNNYTDQDETRIKDNEEYYQYCVYGRETAPTTGTPHLQGYVNFRTKRAFNAIKELLGQSAHIESAKGTDQQNRTYCIKGGDFVEYGTPRGQGHRSDLENVVDLIKSGRTIKEIAESETVQFIKYYRGIERTWQLICPTSGLGVRSFKTEVSTVVT